MMVAGKKKPEEKNTDIPGISRSLRDQAEEQLARSTNISHDLEGQIPEKLIHELEVHQIELETQAEELRKSKIALEESRDKYLDLYEFAPIGYFTLNDKAHVTEVNLTGATLLGVERSNLLKAPFSKFVAVQGSDQWHLYFIQVLQNVEKLTCTLTLTRGDGSMFPARVEGIRIIGSDGTNTVRIALSDITDIWQIEALRGSEEKLQMALSGSETGMWEMDIPSMTGAIDDRAIQILGYQQQDIGPHSTDWDLLLHPKDLPQTHKRLADCLKGNTTFFESEYRMRHASGEWVWVVGKGKITQRNQDGSPLRITGTLQNITDRKQAEDALKESEAKFREIFNAANDAIHLHEVDERGLPGKFIDVNNVACSMVQYNKEELLEKSPLDLTTDYHSISLDQIGEDIKTKGYAIFETEHVRKDGIVVPVEVNAHVVNIQDRRMVLSIIRDLTQRKLDEAAFLRLSRDHKVIIDNVPAMIWYKDTKNNFIRVNPAAARAFGKSIEEIDGKSTYDLFPGFAEKYYQDDLEVINTGKPKLGIEEQMMIARGDLLWVQTDKIPLIGNDGTVTGILVFSVDITERKELENEMKFHEQELLQFSTALATASKKLALLSSITRHDINNQLMSVNGFLELLHEEVPDPILEDYFTRITKASSRIAAMIRFTKEYEQIGVNAPVWQYTRTLVDTAAKQAPLGKVMVEIDIPVGMEMFADPLVVKVFYNLMDNAVRYGGKITTIRFSVEERDGDHIVVCEDDGDGIVAAEKEKIFERGFGKNTGLGLALSREILDITGITIAETGEPGKGARFEMVVPDGMWRVSGTGGKLPE